MEMEWCAIPPQKHNVNGIHFMEKKKTFKEKCVKISGGDNMKLSQYIDYLRLDQRYSPNTVTSYAKAVKQFIEFLGIEGMHPVEAKQSHVRLFLRRFEPSTAALKISAIKNFFDWLIMSEVTEMNPTSGVRRPKIPTRSHHWLSFEDIKALRIHLADDNSWEGIRDRAIIEMLYSTGVRNTPLRNIMLSDLDIVACTARTISKGDREKIQRLNSTTSKAVADWLKIRGVAKDGHLFIRKGGDWLKHNNDLGRIIKKRTGAIGKPVSPHMFRHTHVTHLYMKTKDIVAVQKSADHLNISTTERYMHVIDSAQGESREALA